MNYIPYTLDDVRNTSKKFTVISTFAGGGGSSTGYRLAGGKVLCINEFIPEAVETYSRNFPDTVVLPGDIKELSGDDFLHYANIVAGELDILDGSPPCSAFSISSPKNMGKRHTGSVIDSRRTYFNDDGEIITEGELEVVGGKKTYSGVEVDQIENLFNEFIRVASVIRPKVIIAENVKGITMRSARTKLAEFLKGFEDIGYEVTYKVLNAAQFGVPQSRRRTFFICVRSDVASAIGFNFLNINSIFPQETTPAGVNIKSAIGDIENDPQEVQMLLDAVDKGFQKKYAELLPFNPSKPRKPSDVSDEKGCFNMKRPSPDHPCPTLTQLGQQLGVSGVLHYEQNRKLTIKELKRIMSLPEDFILTGTFDQKAERICRMVAPKMMAELAKSIYQHVILPYRKFEMIYDKI